MSFVNKKLYKQKPQAWGPVSAVKASIFKNAERAGIDPGSIALCMPMWGPGGQIDYANLAADPSYMRAGTGVLFSKNASYFKGSYNATLKVSPQTALDIGNLTEQICIITSFVPDGLPYSHDRAYNQAGKFSFDVNANSVNTMVRFYLYISGSETQLTHYVAVTGGNLYTSISQYDGAQMLSSVNGDVAMTAATGAIDISSSEINYAGVTTANTLPCWAYSFFVLNKAITPSQIAHLSDNPYFLLQRVAPVYYSVPGGAVLPTFNPLFLNAAQPTRVIQ